MKSTLQSIAAAVALLLITGTVAFAEWKPKGPVTMMIGFAAGDNADTQARLIAEELEKRQGWKIILKQVTGGNGAKLAARMRNEPNDGSVIGLMMTETFGYNMVANPSAEYSQADITALTTTSGFQMGVVSLATKNWDDFGEVILAAKAGQNIRFGTMTPKLADLAFLVADANGVEFNIMEVRNSREVLNGISAGEMDLGFMEGTQTDGILAGDLIHLASALSAPLKISPDAPLLSEYGVDFADDDYIFFVGPADMPSDARKALTNAIVDIVTDHASKSNEFITNAFGGTVVISGIDLDRFLVKEAAEAERLLRAAR